MPTFLSFLLRVFLIAAGLLFAASVTVAVALMACVWGVRSLWAKLTGQRVVPFILRIDPRAGFDRMYRRPQRASRTPRADAVRPGRRIADVTDVEPR